MDTEVTVHEAKMHLSKLFQRVINGERIIIGKSGKPVVLLSPLPFVKDRGTEVEISWSGSMMVMSSKPSRFRPIRSRPLQSSIQRSPDTVLIRFIGHIVLLFNLAGPPA